jgi:hypothetical protein
MFCSKKSLACREGNNHTIPVPADTSSRCSTFSSCFSVFLDILKKNGQLGRTYARIDKLSPLDFGVRLQRLWATLRLVLQVCIIVWLGLLRTVVVLTLSFVIRHGLVVACMILGQYEADPLLCFPLLDCSFVSLPVNNVFGRLRRPLS